MIYTLITEPGQEHGAESHSKKYSILNWIERYQADLVWSRAGSRRRLFHL